MGIVNFESNLRSASKDQIQKEKEKKWNNTAYKDKKEFPISYPGFK